LTGICRSEHKSCTHDILKVPSRMKTPETDPRIQHLRLQPKEKDANCSPSARCGGLPLRGRVGGLRERCRAVCAGKRPRGDPHSLGDRGLRPRRDAVGDLGRRHGLHRCRGSGSHPHGARAGIPVPAQGFLHGGGVRRRPALPFVLFTGQGSEEVAERALDAGTTAYLQKRPDPSPYPLLADRVRGLVVRSRAEEPIEQRVG